jgi:hypothetical protein
MALAVNQPLTQVRIYGTATSVATGVNACLPAPFRGRVINVGSVIGSATTTADATCTTSIAGSAITNGVFIITQSSSAAGDLDSSVPSAANTCNKDDVIKFAMTGSGTGGGPVTVFADIIAA